MSALRRAQPRELLNSPWGAPQTIHELGAGVWEIATASHGGIYLEPYRQALIPEPWRDHESWYEEDDQWAFVAITFPELFPAAVADYARLLAAIYHAATYQAVAGEAAALQVLAREPQIRQALKDQAASQAQPTT